MDAASWVASAILVVSGLLSVPTLDGAANAANGPGESRPAAAVGAEEVAHPAAVTEMDLATGTDETDGADKAVDTDDIDDGAGGGPFGSGAEGGGTGSTWSGPVSAAHPDTPSAMHADEQWAVRAVNGFWQRTLNNYRPPRVYGGYAGTNGPRCGLARSVPGNAFYCRPGDFLAWDENLMAAGYQRIGNAWVYLIIAHEWGHAIQARLRRGEVSKAMELQADCFAGAALTGAVRNGSLRAEPTDAEQIREALAAVADRYPWTETADHGDAEERIGAYQTGQRGGWLACLKQ